MVGVGKGVSVMSGWGGEGCECDEWLGWGRVSVMVVWVKGINVKVVGVGEGVSVMVGWGDSE